MQGIFDTVYLIAFISYLLLSVFIIYHIVRYSGNRTVMLFTVSFFLVGTIFVLTANALFFLSIPFDTFIPTFTMPSSYSSATFPFK